MKTIYLYLFVFLLLNIGCNKNIPEPVIVNGVVISQSPLWKVGLTDDTDYVHTKTQLINHNSTVVFGGVEDNHGMLVGLDINTGEEKWKYSNSDLPASSGINIRSKHTYGSKAYMLDSPLNHYFVDIETGVTSSSRSSNYFTRGQSGIDNTLFKTQIKETTDGILYDCVVENNLENPDEFQDVFCPPYNFEYVYVTGYHGFASGRDVYVSEGDNLMLIGFLDATEIPQEVQSYWGVYNLSQKEWEIEKIPIFEENLQVGQAKENNGLFYFTASRVFKCIDPTTMEEVWTKDYSGGMTFIEEHNMLIVTTNHSNETIGLNPQTGEELWHTSVSANSPVHYQDDVIYFIGAGTGRLHALDILTGEELWRLESPDVETDQQAIWKWEINGIPAQNGEKGKIFASTYLSGFCFEAVK